MQPLSAVVVVVDRLGANFLGPYGNTWIETPAFNRLASQSLLAEFMLADSPRLELAYRAYWSGRHAMDPGDVVTSDALPALATRGGLRTVLMTDEPVLLDHPLAAGFEEHILLKGEELSHSATDIAETGMARLFQGAADFIREQQEPFLLWVHARGMAGAWDAPAELRSQFAGEDDPLPDDSTMPPALLVEPGFDPDELLKITHAYAGQVTLLDICLGGLLDAVQENTLTSQAPLVFTSPRGYPLGEHRIVGGTEEALYGELLHVPLLLRLPGGAGALLRTQSLVQPLDLFAAVARSIQLEGAADLPALLLDLAEGREQSRREVACAMSDNQRAIRTPAWFLRESAGDASSGLTPRWELFAKPDDRWEVNEVARRCADIPPMMVELMDAFEAAVGSGQLANLPPIAEVLRDVWR